MLRSCGLARGACTVYPLTGFLSLIGVDQGRFASGRRVLARVISTAANRLMDGIPTFGRSRRLDEAAALFEQASNKLLGQFQLSFFDTDEDETPPRQRRKKRPKRANRTALAQKRPKAVASLLEQV